MLLAVLPASAGDLLTMKIAPPAAPAPAYLSVRVTVDPNTDNRAIEVAVESPEYFTSSRIDLDGDLAPRTTMFAFGRLPSGEYEVTATLVGDRGTRAVASTWFRATASPGER